MAGGIKKTGRYVGQKSGSKGKRKAKVDPGTGVVIDRPSVGQNVKGGSSGT